MAILLFFVVGLAGLACDLAYVYFVSHQLQDTADAASLAGAYHVKTDLQQARLAAARLAVANYAGGQRIELVPNDDNAPGGDVVLGRYDRQTHVFTPTLQGANAVQVVARREASSPNGALAIVFGPVFKVDTVNVRRTAIAMCSGGTGAGLICLDPDKRHSLEVSGTVILDVNGGAIQVNSIHAAGLYANGTPNILASEMNVCGSYNFVGGVEYNCDINPDSPPIPDPLAALPEPSLQGQTNRGTVNVTGGEHLDLQPGYYPGGISMNNGGLTLAPGVYILDGAGLNVTGGDMTAEGVMFYVVDTNPRDKLDPCVKLTGNGVITVTPPDPTVNTGSWASTYEGVSIFQSRSNENDSTIIGTNALNLTGTLYFPSNLLHVSGTSEGLGNQLITNSLDVSGNGEIHIQYDGRNPAPGHKVYLVE